MIKQTKSTTNKSEESNVSDSSVITRTLRRANTEADKDTRRQEILSAAKTVFSKNGFHATTISDVAREAQLSYGSIYWYFDSKDALFHALMESEEDSLKTEIARATAISNFPEQPELTFRAAITATIKFFEQDKAAVKLLFRDSYALGDRFEAHLYNIYEGFIGDIKQVVIEHQNHGDIIDLPPHLVAFSIAALITQFAHRRLETDDGISAEKVSDLILKILLEGLLPRRRLSVSK